MKPYKILAIAFLILFFLVVFNENSLAQCAMCKGAISEKANDGESNFGQGLNNGILYLMSFPYIIFGTLAFFWYKESKKGDGKSNSLLQAFKRKFNV
jgi:hypothetical protein